MKLATFETLHCNAGWRNFSFLKLTTADGLTGISEYLDEFVKRMDSCSELIAVVRSGAMAVARGESLLGAQRA